MPSYDYHCRHCGTLFETRHPMSVARPPCPDCGGEAELVILHAPAVHGSMARGRKLAMQTLEPSAASAHGPHCPCCR